MSAVEHWFPTGWRPLSELPSAPHGRVVEVMCLTGYACTRTVTHGEPRAHGATLTVELPPLAALWRYA